MELAKTSLTVALLAAGIYFLYRYFSNQVELKDVVIQKQLDLKDSIIKAQSEFIQKSSVDNVRMMGDFSKTLDHMMEMIQEGDEDMSDNSEKILKDIQVIRTEMSNKMNEILVAVKSNK